MVTDLGGAGDRRLLQFVLDAPGAELPVDLTVIYRETYVRAGRGWSLTKYTYDCVQRTAPWRLAYHRHDVATRRDVAHAHCNRGVVGAASGPGPEAGHLRATEIALLEAHAEFMRRYAADLGPDCDRFLPLRVPR